MKWWSFFRPVRFFYGYAGDTTPDHPSMQGIGNSPNALEPGSLEPEVSASLTPAGARARNLHPIVNKNGVETASGETFVENGKTYRWDDTYPGSSHYLDIYTPDRAPDSGVSAERIAADRAYMAKNNPRFSGGLPAAPPKGATFVRPSPAPSTAQDLGPEHGPAEQQEQAPETQQQPEQQPAQGPLPPTPMLAPLGQDQPPPGNAAQQAPVSQAQIDQIKADAANDPEVQEAEQEKQAQLAAEKSQVRIMDAHSAAVAQNSGDNRVTRRINPDTGSDKIVGQYFVPGDPVHEEMLSGMDPMHRAKLPVISQAIARGGPYSFLYGSAQQEGGPQEWEGERPTGESRQFEQAQSPVEQRLSGEAPQQSQRVSMLPMQMMMSQGGNPLLEGFSNDAVMNNGAHLLAAAQQAKLPVPYNSIQDPNLHKDVMGFLENQAHGFMGDGTPMVDENGQPHPLHVANQQSANPYVPRLMQRPQAEFVHGMLNIRQPKNPKPPTKPPGFGERAAWQRRVNQGYTGQPAGFNNFLRKLDTQLPNVGMRNKKGKITRTVPWSEGTLEPTWRAYRPELMSQLGAPPIGTQSMRATGAPEQIIHRAPHFRQTLAQYQPHQPTAIDQDPAIGAPLGAGGEKITHAAVRDKRTGKIYKGYNHQHAYDLARETDPSFSGWAPEEDEGFWTNQGKFYNRQEAWNLARNANQLVNAGDEPTLHAEQVQGRKLDTWDMPYGTTKGAVPIAENPEVGAPLGEGNPKPTAVRWKKPIEKNKLHKLGDLIHHPDLFSAHPDLKDLTVNTWDYQRGNGYSKAEGPFPESIMLPGLNRKSLLHEIGHAIQNREGRSTGAGLVYGRDPTPEEHRRYYNDPAEVEARAYAEKYFKPEQLPQQEQPGAAPISQNPTGPGPAPISENPEVGGPLGEKEDWGKNEPEKGFGEHSHAKFFGRNYTIFRHKKKGYYAQDQFGEKTPLASTEEQSRFHAYHHAREINENALSLQQELKAEQEAEQAAKEKRVIPEPGRYDFEPHPPEDPDEYWITDKGKPIGFVDREEHAWQILDALEKGHITPHETLADRVKQAQDYKSRLLGHYADPTKGMSTEELSRRAEQANQSINELSQLYENKMGPLIGRHDEPPGLHEPSPEAPEQQRGEYGMGGDWWKQGGSPLSGNPEVGAPAGTPNAPGQPGLLASDTGEEPMQATSPQSAPEEFGQVPGGGGGIDFASPNVREGMNMNMAKIALRNPKSGHGSYRDFNGRLEQAAAKATNSPQPEMRDAIGSWADGAENSLRMLYGKQDRKTRKLVNAIRGLHSAQKQVLNFHYDDEGPHRIAHLSFHHDNPQYVSDLLDKHGIQFRTLEAPGKGERVWAHVVDPDGELYPKLEKLISGGHVHEGYFRTGHADFVGDPNGEDREAARGEYQQILGEARAEADQRWKGRGKSSRAARPQEWWEPFAQEAGLNYDRLKAGDELKKQQLAKDLGAAEADRQNVTPQRAKELEQIRSVAQDWVNKNPKLHNLAVHHYLPGGTQSLPEGADNEEVAKHFEARNPRLDYSKDTDRKKAALAMTHDIMRNLAANPKSYGWYDSTVDKAMNKIAEVAPEIKSDPAHAMALRLAMAVTSQGQKVVPNFESAYKIYRYWKQTGKFPVMDPDEWKDQFGGGTKRDAMIKNFEKLNELWDKHKLGGWSEILKTPITVGELKREHDLTVSGEAADHTLPGAAFMGPKIGIFYSNLNKIFHHTTMDLWFSRTLNRLAGNMFKFSPSALTKGGGEAGGEEDEEEPDEKSQQSQLDRLEAVMKSTGLSGVSKEDHKAIAGEMDKLRNAKDLTRLQAMKLAPTLTRYVDERHRFYMKGEGYEGSYPKALGNEENRSAKNIDLNFHGLSDAPRTSTERKQWRAVMDQVDKNLKGAGLNVNAADKQALLWYLEQGLFQGPNAKSSMDYLDAAHILTRKVKNGEI
jgi:hypothetical protein